MLALTPRIFGVATLCVSQETLVKDGNVCEDRDCPDAGGEHGHSIDLSPRDFILPPRLERITIAEDHKAAWMWLLRGLKRITS